MKIEICNLTKTYYLPNKTVPVLNDLSFAFESGEFLSITGASGTGKSTLLHLIGALDKPSSGDIFFDGESLGAMNSGRVAKFRNANIGYVFQFHHLLPDFSALENVMMPCLIGQMKRSEAKGKAEHLLEKVGLADRIGHRPGELSGGEQQRVALARALSNSPEILLADEPTGNLDEKTGDGIFDIMRSLSEDDGLSVIIVTHSLRLAGKTNRHLLLEKIGAHGEVSALKEV